MNLPNHLARFQTFIISTIAAPVLIYPPTGWADECMVTLADPDGYTLAGSFSGETTTK